MRWKRKPIQPKLIADIGQYYLPVPDYGHDPIPLSIWRLGHRRPPQDFWGNTGRIYDQQILACEGPLMQVIQRGIATGQGGTGVAFGQSVSLPVMGFAGRPAVLTEISQAMEWNQVQGSGVAYSPYQPMTLDEYNGS